jgi:hypothetical protein
MSHAQDMLVKFDRSAKELAVPPGRGPHLRRWRAFVIFAVINLAFLCFFADRDGYEGDDLNSIVPMFHLEAAKSGSLEIYRYAWQPLSYEIGAQVIKHISPRAVFLLSPICAALSLVLLLTLVWRSGSTREEGVAALVVLLAVPEFWFSGLYYNSTMVGMPLAVGSLLLVRSEPRVASAALAGFLVAIAVLMRLDFILICPALILIAWRRATLRFAALFVAVILTVLGFALYFGLIQPDNILQIQRTSAAEIAAKAHSGGWNLRAKLFVVTVLLSPVGWCILLGAPLVIRDALKRDVWLTLLYALALIPLFIPLMAPLSPKYVLPLAVFLPSFLRQCLLAIEAKMPDSLKIWPLRIAAIGTAILLVVSINLRRPPIFIQFSTFSTRPVGTHDGHRSYGGYVWEAAQVDRLRPRWHDQLAADRLLNDFMSSNGPDLVVVGAENVFTKGAIGWRHLQLELEQRGIHGILAGPRRIQFNSKYRRITLLRDLGAETMKSLDRGKAIRIIDLGDDQGETRFD